MELTLAGKAKEEQSSKAGTYILRDSLVNGYPNWLKTDESKVIWFDKFNSNWKVAPKNYLGTTRGGFAGPKGKDDYPQAIESGWRYGAGDTHLDAGQHDVIFKVIGTFLKPLLYKMNSTFVTSQTFTKTKIICFFTKSF